MVDTAGAAATNPGSVLGYLNNNNWKLSTAPGFGWLMYDKGDSKLKDGDGNSSDTYKVFVQPTADKFVEYVDRVSKTLDGLVERGEISGARFKFSKVGDMFNRDELGEYKVFHGKGVDEKRLDVSYAEKIVIYTRSPEEMEKVVKALNSTFKDDAYKHGTEKDLDTYGLKNGAKWTYGINPLIHVRRGGSANHNLRNNDRLKKGEAVDKPPEGWDIPKEVIDRLRLDSKSKAGMS